MTSSRGYWTRFWQDKDDPLHSANDETYYDLMAAEMLVLLGSYRFGSVLELGCGNGAFYKRLGFHQARYFGVDFSPTMLSTFRKTHPGTRLEAADVSRYVPPEPVDLIYSGSLLQYLSPGDIDRHLGGVRASLNPGGQILHACVPWNVMRWPYYSGMLKARQEGRLRATAVYLAVRFGLRPSLGYWHSIGAVRAIAARHGFDTTFYGSLLYPYRFHVRMVAHAP
jgi:trans-aconitate methyltransferase